MEAFRGKEATGWDAHANDLTRRLRKRIRRKNTINQGAQEPGEAEADATAPLTDGDEPKPCFDWFIPMQLPRGPQINASSPLLPGCALISNEPIRNHGSWLPGPWNHGHSLLLIGHLAGHAIVTRRSGSGGGKMEKMYSAKDGSSTMRGSEEAWTACRYDKSMPRNSLVGLCILDYTGVFYKLAWKTNRLNTQVKQPTTLDSADWGATLTEQKLTHTADQKHTEA